MKETKKELGIKIRLESTFDEALARVVDALRSEGFGVLTEIDVKNTLKSKLDIEFRNYRILGACNPPLAYRALTSAPEVGMLLPCNVTVDEVTDNLIEVSILDPAIMAGFFDDAVLVDVADEARDRLQRVASALQGS